MKQATLRLLWAIATVFPLAGSAHATPITYIHNQTSSSNGGVFVGIRMVINGTIADLPAIVNGLPQSTFGNLLEFEFRTPNLQHGYTTPMSVQPVTLADFTQMPPLGSDFPVWGISPLGIYYTDKEHANKFEIVFATGKVELHGDNAQPIECYQFGRCFTLGEFSAVETPEPATLGLVGLGLSAALLRRKKNAKP
jgi:hypothetical protein